MSVGLDRQFLVKGAYKKGQEKIGLGVFDGVHLGHQKIESLTTSMLTFSPHPLTVLRGGRIPQLTTATEMAYFVKNLLVVDFTTQLAALAPEQFLERVIWEQIQPKEIVVGYDFRFGAKQAGTLEVLHRWCIQKDITLTVVEPIKHASYEEPVKSSIIRRFIQDGNFQQAVDLLGHPYPVVGTVVQGDGRGRNLGFPTANLKLNSNKLVPNPGVYAGTVLLKDVPLTCMVYIGNRPTFKGQTSSFEVHVLKEEANQFMSQQKESSFDLYRQSLPLFMSHFVRSEMTFESKEALIQQIESDIASVKNIEKSLVKC